jgi:hypothetical protein
MKYFVLARIGRLCATGCMKRMVRRDCSFRLHMAPSHSQAVFFVVNNKKYKPVAAEPKRRQPRPVRLHSASTVVMVGA